MSRTNDTINVNEMVNYKTLAPVNNAENAEGYLEAINWALNNKKVYNIALTGPYGAGKSSILETYLASKSDREREYYLNISLATFDGQKIEESYDSSQVDSAGKEDTPRKIEDSEIEKSILQQLFYKVDPEKIPYTRFRKIHNRSKKQIGIYCGIVLMAIMLGILFINPVLIINLKNNIATAQEIFPKLNISILGIAFIGIAMYLIINIAYLCNARFSMRDINLSHTKSGAKLTANTVNDESIFNKYLDEILYFFEVTKYKVVFIQDLDRFNNTRIFTKLRELNALINESEKINRRVVFIYAIKDEMFTNKDRTKFFEFIIPVIPVIDASNSGEKFLAEKHKNIMWNDITDEYINVVSVYVDDMRIFNCICNEFYVYKKTLTDVSLKSEYMLSLIIYKNLYPNDFALLPIQQGVLHQAFKNKKSVMNKILKDMKMERQALEKSLKSIEQEHLASLKELKAAFLYFLSGETMNIQAIGISYSQMYNIDQIFENNFDMSILNTNYIYINRCNGLSDRGNFLEEANRQSGSSLNYFERFKNMQDALERKREEIKDKINVLLNQEKKVESLTLKQLIKQYDVREVLTKEVLEEPLLVFLLRNGYINETYPNYLTYFYPNSVTAQDMNFILGVRNREAKQFDYPLTYIKQIISRLNHYEFAQSEMLNIPMVEYLLENKSDNKECLGLILKQLKNETELSIEFIGQFKTRGRNWRALCKELCHIWSNMWNYYESRSEFTSNKLDEYLKDIIEYAEVVDIFEMNSNGKLTKYISNRAGFVKLVKDIEIHKVKQIIEGLQVKFEDIDYLNGNMALVGYIFEKSMYKINQQMIESIIKWGYPQHIEDMECKNLTTIKTIAYAPMISYIEDNMPEYIEKVFLQIESNTEEDVETIIELLNNAQISDELKVRIIDKENCIIKDITKIKASAAVWDSLFTKLKVEESWENVQAYFVENKQKLTETLVNYLDNSKIYTALSCTKLECSEVVIDLIDQLIHSTITNEALSNLGRSISFSYQDFNVESLTEERIVMLIKDKILELTVENYNRLREIERDYHILLIEQNGKQFIKEQEEYELDEDEVCKILKSGMFSEKEKIHIIDNIEKDVTSEELLREIGSLYLSAGTRYQMDSNIFKEVWGVVTPTECIELLINQMEHLDDEVMRECLINNSEQFILFIKSTAFTTEQKYNLIVQWEDYIRDTKILREIYQLISGSKYNLPEELLNNIWNVLESDEKLLLLVDQLEFLADDMSITRLLQDLEKPLSEIAIRDGKIVKVPLNEQVIKLAEGLKNKGYISSFDPVDAMVIFRKKRPINRD